MSTPTYATVEEAQARIVELQEQLTEVTNERDTLSQNNEKLTGELDQVRALNQKYFNKLTAQYTPAEDEKEEREEEVPSCEDFARTLNI